MQTIRPYFLLVYFFMKSKTVLENQTFLKHFFLRNVGTTQTSFSVGPFNTQSVHFFCQLYLNINLHLVQNRLSRKEMNCWKKCWTWNVCGFNDDCANWSCQLCLRICLLAEIKQLELELKLRTLKSLNHVLLRKPLWMENYQSFRAIHTAFTDNKGYN